MHSNKDIVFMVEAGCNHWVLESKYRLRILVHIAYLVQIKSLIELMPLIVKYFCHELSVVWVWQAKHISFCVLLDLIHDDIVSIDIEGVAQFSRFHNVLADRTLFVVDIGATRNSVFGVISDDDVDDEVAIGVHHHFFKQVLKNVLLVFF